MLGGIAGHAGIFTNTNDLAKIFQMYLQKGEYGGKRYINASTLTLYTKQAHPRSRNRRALGFDRPAKNAKKRSVCASASQKSFGHTGFTGTIAWVDPEYNFVYIFLANRIHPDIENRKFIDMNIRPKVQEIFYEAIRN